MHQSNNATISESIWYFAPNASVCYNDKGIPSGSVFSLTAGCGSFVQTKTNETIVPRFLFEFGSKSKHPVIQCNGTKLEVTSDIHEVTPITHSIGAECADLTFVLCDNVDFCITSLDSVDISGVNCDSGL